MPIPFTQPCLTLELVPVPAAPPPVRADFLSRVVAHAFDFCFIVGLSSYLSIVTFVLFAILRAPEFRSFGRMANAVFADTYEVVGAQLFAGSFALISVALLVAFPLAAAKTPGMGLMGLRLRNEGGAALSTRILLTRLAGSYFTYFAFGIPCFIALMREDGTLFQDRLSGTFVVRDE